MASLPLSYCAELVRRHDYDRYLCTLFAPAAIRESWFALFAFNHEIATVAEVVSEEMIGFIRFAWWREALDEIYGAGAVRKHPVTEALAVAVRGHGLPRALLEAMIDARESMLGTGAAEAVPDEAYFKATSSGLLALCALAAGEEDSAAIVALGVAWAGVGMARLVQASGQKDPVLVEMAAEKLACADSIPVIFMPFKAVTEFYLKRLKAGRSAGRETRFFLTFNLCWRRLAGKI